MRKDFFGKNNKNKKKKNGFPDLNKDGKVSFKDFLIGRV